MPCCPLVRLHGCCAVDVTTVSWEPELRDKFIDLARARGFSIGFAKTFIHIDARTSYPDTGKTRQAEGTY